MMKYKHSLPLYKIYNNEKQGEDWMDLNFKQSFNIATTVTYEQSTFPFPFPLPGRTTMKSLLQRLSGCKAIQKKERHF